MAAAADRYVRQQPVLLGNQPVHHPAFAGRQNLAESQKGAIWAGFFACLDVFVIVPPGIIAFQLLAANGQMDTFGRHGG